MATLKEALEYAKMNPNSSFATALRTKIENGEADAQAQAEGIQLPGRQQSPSFLDKVGSAVSERYGNIKNELTSNQVTSPVNLQASAMEKGLRVAGQAAGAVGDIIGAGIGSAASTVNEITGGAAGEATKAGASYILNTDLGKQGLNFAQQGMEKYSEWKQANPNAAKDLEAVVNIASIIPIGKGAGMAVQGAEDLAKSGAALAKTGAEAVANAPIISGTGEVLQAAGRTLKNIPENIATNVGEMQAKEAVIKSIPSELGQKAVRSGLDVADAKTLQQTVDTPEARNLLEAVKNFAAGTSKVDPIEVVGRPLSQKIKTADKQLQSIGAKLREESKNLGKLDYEVVHSSVLKRLREIPGLNNLDIDVEGKLDFSNTNLASALTKADRKIIEKAFQEAVISGSGEKAHLFRQELFEILEGKKKSLSTLTDTQDKALNAIRTGLLDVLETNNPAYRQYSQEFAKIARPLSELRKLSKTLDPNNPQDILELSAGLLARRLTSAAPSNPRIRLVLKDLDSVTKGSGNASESTEKILDMYNVLNKYYDIAPRTGFQNLVKEGVQSAEGVYAEIANKIKGFAGTSNAVRQKNLENYLEELLNPASPKTSTKTKKATNVQIKNDNISSSIPQTPNKASGKLGGFAQFLKETPDGKLKGKMVPEDADAVVDFAEAVNGESVVPDKTYLAMRKEIKKIAKQYNIPGKTDRELVDNLTKKIYRDYHKFPGFSELGLLPKLAIGTAGGVGAVKLMSTQDK